MSALPRPAIIAFFAAATLWLAMQLGTLTLGLRVPTEDDEMVAAGAIDPTKTQDYRRYDYEMGRLYAGVKFDFLEAVMRVKSDWRHAAVRLALLLMTAGCAAWFTWEWRRNLREALLVLVAIVGLLQVSVSYQAFLSQQWFWFGWAAVWTMGALALRPDSTANRCGIVAAFALALFSHESNAVFLFWPVAVRLVGRGEKFSWATLQPFWSCVLVLALYGGVSLALRRATSDPEHVYAGTILSPDLGRFALALNVFSLSSIPGLESWRVRWSDAGMPLWLTPAQWLENLRAGITVVNMAGAALVGLAVWLGLAREEKPDGRASPAAPLAMLALILAAAYAPNLLLAATIKYQGWAQQRMWPYYYSAMSYLAWIVLGVTGTSIFLSRLQNPAGRAVGRLGAAGLATVIALSVYVSSLEAVGYLRQEPLHHIKGYPHGPLKK